MNGPIAPCRLDAIVAERHEVSSQTAPHDEHIGRILQVIDADDSVSQRSIASKLGIALGLTNLLVKRLVTRGLIRVRHIQRHRVRYFLTPAGMAEKARMSRLALASAVERYAEARRRIRDTFQRISVEWPENRGGGQKRILFLGTGEVAEIGFICLHETDLTLAGVVDDQGRSEFLGVQVYPADALSGDLLREAEAASVVVMSLRDDHQLRHHLASLGLNSSEVFWL